MTFNNGTTLVDRERTPPGYVLSVILSSTLIAGTGSVTNAASHVNGTYLCGLVRGTIPGDEILESSSLRSLLHDVRSNFQLTAVELAAVLGVSRQTLYDWVAERTAPRTDKQRRIRELFGLSTQWRAFIGPNIATVDRKFADKPELLETLRDSSLSAAEKEQRLQDLANRRRGVEAPHSISDRLKALGFKRTPEAQQHALDNREW